MASLGPAAQLRSLCDRARQLTRHGDGRFLDAAIEIHQVAQDVEHGVEALPGKPPLVGIAKPIRVGGRYDLTTQKWVECDWATLDPIIWYMGPRQAAMLLDEDPEKTRTLLYAAEGAGKSSILAQFIAYRSIILSLRDGYRGYAGCTAPTNQRLNTMISAVGNFVPVDTPTDRVPGAWATYHSGTNEIRFAFGVTVECRSTKKQSNATGSAIQGMNWAFSADDELQDTIENGGSAEDADIEARLRAVEVSRRMGSATAKDSAGWRRARDKKIASQDWKIERIDYTETPFIWPAHWERMKRNMSPREWRRRGEALDVKPENALYYAFDKVRQVISIPRSWRDVTAEILRPFAPTRHIGMLVGYDPGRAKHVAVYLKAFRVPFQEEVSWVVVGELECPETDTAGFAVALGNDLRARFGIQYKTAEDPQALVVSDKYVDNEVSAKRDRTVYTTMRNAGFVIRPAEYKKRVPQGVAPGPGSVPVWSAIEMVNRLSINAVRETRLYIEKRDDGNPAAPRLIECLEASEKGPDGGAEGNKRHKKGDVSDLPCALRLGLWPFEKVRRDFSLGEEAA